MSKNKPFNQVPVYNENFIKIPIEDFIELQDMLSAFVAPFQLVQHAYYQAINEGAITFKYEEEDGNEISEDEARQRVKEFNETEK